MTDRSDELAATYVEVLNAGHVDPTAAEATGYYGQPLDDTDGALPAPTTQWLSLSPRERRIWSSGYKHAEDDYLVRRIPALLRLAEVAADLTDNPEHRELVATFGKLVAQYNDERTL